ncbi:MAG: aspartate ammonia-lyase [archaeon]|nr:aspartate ammonia-lyase [archaeon]
MSEEFREESDLLGTKKIPKNALYGIQSLRGFENFQISTVPMSNFPNFVKGFAITKKACALANHDLNLLNDEKFKAITKACDELFELKHIEYLKSDMIQGGAGTTMNMNVNEVIANRALQIMGKQLGEYKQCSPNDDVNRSQSTNDAFPTAFHLGLYFENEKLVKSLKELGESFNKKAIEFKDIVKMGRTHLQDAVPMTLGQTFSSYASSCLEHLPLLEHASNLFLTVNMGATAIGTGICSQPEFKEKVIHYLQKETGLNIKSAENLVFATSDTSCLVAYHSCLKHLAMKLTKIAMDLRIISSGPRCGLNEINLPQLQPGSSIMPGKVNPVIPEVVNQLCFKVIGNDTTISLGGENSFLELNTMEPVMIYATFESMDLLINGMNTFRTKCIDGITANKERCEYYVKNSIGIVTALNPYIGYKNSTKIAKEAMETGKAPYDLVLEHDILSKEDLDLILNPENMIKPVKLDIKVKNDL